MQEEMKRLPPLANLIVDRAIDNTNRKLVAGLRNKRNSRAGAKSTDLGVVASDTLDAVSADSVMAVANRGQAWREMIEKSLTHGISSLKTMRFDGEFSIQDGKPTGLENVPNKPGVYVVFDKQGQAVYVGDSGQLQKRWHAGHLNEYRQGERANDPYKLAPEFAEGCTVRYVVMESEATAAALEAHLIKTEEPRVNSRQELKSEQGTRDNIEAKKMKDASGSTASLAAQAEAIRQGCDQVVFQDAVERKYVEELGGMNVFFVFEDGSIQTPPLGGTILPGITRDSLIVLARDLGLTVREEPYSIDQWRADAASGRLTEAFACGTAAVVTPIGKVKGSSFEATIGDGGAGPVTTKLKAALLDIQNGRAEDRHGWLQRVF